MYSEHAAQTKLFCCAFLCGAAQSRVTPAWAASMEEVVHEGLENASLFAAWGHAIRHPQHIAMESSEWELRMAV